MNEHRNCTCPASKSGSFQIATDHYSRNFIPTGWKLEYTSLEQHEPQRFLYMTGWCLRCGGQDLQSGISIPDELSGDALLERIYREMEHYRPFEHRRSDGTYNRSLLGRAAWYMEQDDLTLGEKNAQFLKLFHEEDQRAVEDWICRNRAEEPYWRPPEATGRPVGQRCAAPSQTRPAFSKCLRNMARAIKPPMIAPTTGARNSTTSMELDDSAARVFT